MTGSTLLGGRNVRVLRDGPVRIALHGHFSTSDQDLLKIASGVIQYQRTFFGERQDQPFLVNIAEVLSEPGVRGAIGGTGQDDAYSIAMTEDVPRSQLLSTFAHETFHSWTIGQTTREELWLHEGFTDYFATATALRAGLMTLDEFVEVWNDRLLAYAASPARTRGNADMTNRWVDPAAERMQYLRGALLAVVLDRRLRDASAGRISLDSIIAEQHRRASIDPQASALDMLRQLTASAGVDISADLATHIDKSQRIILSQGAFGPCFQVETRETPSYDRGFDMEATVKAAMIATGVDRAGPAYAAGLRNGMKLVRALEGRLGDSTQRAAWLVEVNGQQHILRWLPAGAGRMTVQMLVRVPDASADPIECSLN
ncbi:MAG: hypothetical protein GC155_14155 [Alphaproteobacteria bacterium]|nr:hypothetical protein [Alphaproteobacteria bacterium]